MSVEDPEESELLKGGEETEQLVHESLDGWQRSALERESRSCSSFIPPALVVLLAFFGVAFYFVERPHARRAAIGEALTDPPGTRDAVAPTILISLDGFRHEYLSRRDPDNPEAMLAPNLYEIATKGATAVNGMQPVVPTKTFPNHWTLVTGLYPENHGIVGNTMYDPETRKWFHLNILHPDWWFGQPIWQTIRQTPRVLLQKNGTRTTLQENYTSACVFWPGSDVPKHSANVYWNYNGETSYEARVHRVLSLLNGTASDLHGRAHFSTLYLEGVDHAGHTFGPHSTEMNVQIKKVDDTIGLLLSSLGSRWAEQYNIVVVSDHGMTEISPDRAIDLSGHVKPGTVQDIATSPLGLFLNMTVTAESLYNDIKSGLTGHEANVSVFRKAELPERWHLRESRLITEVVTMAALGWTVEFPHQHIVPDADKPLERVSIRRVTDKGNHGYDNTFDDMQAIFLARGPAFRDGATVKNMRALDLYEMLCHVFSAQPAPNNGSIETTLSTILKTTDRL